MQASILLSLSLSTLCAAHFELVYPGTRGNSDDTIATWPCGGFDEVSSTRVDFPLAGGPIQIDNSHTESLLQVVAAVGNEPTGDDFTTVLVPTVSERGPGEFCFGSVTFPAEANVTDGTNATIQVITSGHDGGLYACVDVTLRSTTLSPEEYSENCVNRTGVSVEPLSGQMMNANESATHDHGEGESQGDETSTAAAASPSETNTAGTRLAYSSWTFGAIMFLVAAFALP